MWPLVRQARYLGRYQQIAHVFGRHGFGFLLEQMGLTTLLSLPRRMILRVPPPRPISIPERLCQAMIELGPTFIKLGQLLSTRPDLLPPEFVAEFDRLQDTVPSFPSEIAIATIETELGRPLHMLFQEFCTTPPGCCLSGPGTCRTPANRRAGGRQSTTARYSAHYRY